MPIAAGTRLGPYEILGTLGAGGMGQVYRARDTRLHRTVAIKLLTADEMGDATERLLREARHASALNHPNICTVHEIETDGATPFIVMELVEGESLDRRIAGGGLPLATVLRLGRQVAEALGHAHARGIVHRDLKCANVAVTTEGNAKILDFGIARRVLPADLGSSMQSVATLTDEQVVAGTLPYMAPEVLGGGAADARSDLWALGVMLVEMASGVRPFTGATSVALTTAIMRDPPVLPATIDARLMPVIRKLLAKDPSERYQSAREVTAALDLVESGSAVQTERPVAAARLRRAIGPSTAVIIVLAIVASGYLKWRGGPSGVVSHSRIGSLAVLPLDNLSNDAKEDYFADGMTEALISQLAAIDELRVISRTSVMQFRKTTQPLPQIAAALGVDAIVEGAVTRTADTVRITARLIDARTERGVWRGEYEKPLVDAISLQREIAATIGREIQGELTPDDTARLARRSNVDPQALQSYLQGRFLWNRRASSDLLQAAGWFEDAIRRDPGFALAHAGLADVYLLLGDFRDMRPADAYVRARTAVDAALRLDPNLAEAHATRAWLAFALDRDWAAAEKSFDEALRLNAGYATAHQWRGEFLAALGRFDEAFASLKRADALDPLALMPQAIHGWTAYLSGRLDESIALCEAVLKRNPAFRPARMYRAWAYMDQNRLDEAEREINTLLQTSTSRAVPVATLGRIAARRGQVSAARAAIDELRSLPYPPSFDIAKVYAELHDRTATLEWLDKAEAERNSAVLYIALDRSFVWLQKDPAFEALLTRLKLR